MSPRPAGRHALGAATAVAALTLVVLLVALVGGFSTARADDPGAPSSDPSSDAIQVDDALLRWGVNDESNNKAFAPGTYNFLSAGVVPDPGSGGQAVVKGTWQGTRTKAWWAERGHVRIEKRRPDGSYRRATFAGLATTVDGDPIPTTNGPFSEHQVVIDGGTGTVDPGAGTATIRWTGSFSVLYYSGYTFFTVTDPELRVTPERAVVRATLAGYASDRLDPSVWAPVAPRRVVLMELDREALDLPDAGGFTAEPDYLGVRYETPASSGSSQVRSGTWGAFPASYLRYLEKVGSAAFWYSTGGAADAHKVPAPLTVSYEATDPVDEPMAPEPTETVTDPSATPTTTVNPEPPTASPTQPTQQTPPAPPTPPAADEVPAPVVPTVEAAPVLDPRLAPVPAVYALTSGAPEAAEGPDSDPLDPSWTWWLGSALLLGAAALTLLGNRPKGTP